MANAEHVELLRQGVKEWNKWRRNFEATPDLSGAVLSGVVLRGADLSGAVLSRAVLSEADLSGAVLRGAVLSKADLRRAVLSKADLRRAVLSKADLREAYLRGARLRGAYLHEADLREADLHEADLREADLRGAHLRGAHLRGAHLRGAVLSEAVLSGVNLSNANLRQSDFRGSTLQRVNFTQAQLVAANFVQADLRDAMLLGANFQGAYLQGANLRNAYLVKANLKSANFSWARLQQSNLAGADLTQATLCNANLTQASLLRSNLAGADLRQATLNQAICEETQFIESKLGAASFYKADATGASFYKADAIGVDFQRAILTGACIEDWNINSATNLKDVVCEHIYLKEKAQERRPHGGSFQLGEFTQRFQKFLETVDLFFVDGVDWKAFLTSFQDLQSEYGDKNLAIQGIERKAQSSFEIRLAVPPEADKAEIERVAYERYEINLKQLEAQYRKELAAKDVDIQKYQQKNEQLADELLSTYRQQNSNLTELVKLAASRPITIETTAVADQSSSTHQTFNAAVGNAAGTNYGNMSAIQNNYGPNTEDITRLLTALRDQAQTFPTDQKDNANDVLDDLERDLAEEQPDQGRIGRRLKKLVTLGAAIGTIASGAAAVSGDVSTFTDNVIELTEQLGIPVEQVQSEQLPPGNQP